MTKKVIYSAFSDERRSIIDHLSKKRGWDPLMVIGQARDRQWVEGHYTNAWFYEDMQIRNAQFHYGPPLGQAVPVDLKIINALSKYEFFTLGQVEDTTGWNFSYKERKRYYYDLLTFLNTVIHRMKPDIYVAWTMPHIPFDYALYHLCKYYHIPVLFFNPTALFNYGESQYYHVNVSLEDQSDLFKDVYGLAGPYKLSPEIKQYLDFTRSKEGTVQPTIRYFYDHVEDMWNPSFWYKWTKLGWNLIKLLFKGKLFEKLTYASWKCNKLPFDSQRSKMNYLQHFLFFDRLRRNDKKLSKLYEKYCEKPDLGKKFIYFAAAKQPEAGVWNVYQDNFLILDILTASIPDDWFVYYKEHPCEFVPGGRGSLGRDVYYYDRLSRNKKVKIIPADTSTFTLIDAAQATATPSGTVGWEAVVRGKPVLLFGSVWYQGCKSILKIETYQDCVAAIEKIMNGYKPDQLDVDRFAAVVERMSYKNIIHGDFIYKKIRDCSDVEYEMGRMATALYETYERYYGVRQKDESMITVLNEKV